MQFKTKEIELVPENQRRKKCIQALTQVQSKNNDFQQLSIDRK